MTRPPSGATEFGAYLRRQRQAAGLSLRALEAATGIDDGLLSRWERGERVPRPEAARALDQVLHTGREFVQRAAAARERARRGGPVPMQLPPTGAALVGRDADLTRVDEAVDRAATVVLEGPGGVGKTALLAHWVHRQDVRNRWPDGVLHASLAGYSPVSAPADPTSVLGTLLRDLGTTSIPDGLEERQRLWNTALAGRRMLVLLDDAATLQQVRPLLAGHGCTTIITARRRMPGLQIRDGAARVPVRRLDVDAACRVLAAGGLHDRSVAEQVAEACDRLPLALHAAAVVLAERDQDEAVALLTGPRRLDVLNAAAADDPASAIRVVLAASVQRAIAAVADRIDIDAEQAREAMQRLAAGAEASSSPEVAAALVHEHLAVERGPRLHLDGLLRAYLASAVGTR